MFFGKKRAVGSGGAPVETLIGKNTQIVGDVVFSGGLHLDGAIKGNVYAKDGADGVLIIHEGARIEGEVRAPNLVVNGTIDGDVHAAGRIELGAKARITGNLHYNLIEMAIGSEVNGSLVHRSGGAPQLEHQPDV